MRPTMKIILCVLGLLFPLPTIAQTLPSPSFQGLKLLGAVTAPVADGAVSLNQNTSKTATQIYTSISPPGWFYWDTVRSVLNMKPGMTAQGAAAYGAYIYNEKVQTGGGENSVGLFVNSVNAVAGAHTWGINPSCGDSFDNTIGNSVASTCVGAEFDHTNYNAGSIHEGASFIIQGTVMPAAANVLQVGISLGSVAKWINGFVTNDGAITTAALQIGALATTGTNISAQPFRANIFNSAGTEKAAILQAIPYGLSSAWQFSDASLANGLYIANAATGYAPIISASGADANINLDFYAKGSGAVRIQSPLSVTGTSNFTGAVGVTGAGIFTGTVTANGYAARAGLGGAASGNMFNVNWTGSEAALWLDASNLGKIWVVTAGTIGVTKTCGVLPTVVNGVITAC